VSTPPSRSAPSTGAELLDPVSAAARTALHDDVLRLAAELVRIDTTNRGGGDCREQPAAEYVAERLAEAGHEPLVLPLAPGRPNLVLRVPGRRPELPAALVHGHLDVVPAQAEDWTVPPFSGEVVDGTLWGRGTIDMKGTVAMTLAVLRHWARTGTGPQRDMVFAYTCDEEDTGAGAAHLARHHGDLFEGVTEGFSETGGHTVHLPDGTRVYPIAAGERGSAWLRLTATGEAGHGSRPDGVNAVGRLAAAMARIDAHRWPLHLAAPVRAAVTALAELRGVQLDLDDPALTRDQLLAALGPAAELVDGVLSVSTNLTMLDAGYKVNVIPGSAVGHVDGRIVPGAETEFEQTVDRLVGPDVSWEYYHRSPALEAPVTGSTFDAMAAAVLAQDPGGHVVPWCMSGGTDAKQFAELGITGYGFAPFVLPPGVQFDTLFHGVDERVPVSALHGGVDVLEHFLTRLT
jgi:acetylornithine deacetylase/succinyl-diaminopimelate desuccinylase-like protein